MSEFFKTLDATFKEFNTFIGDVELKINEKMKFPTKEDLNFKYTEEVVETDTQKTVKESWNGLSGNVSFTRSVTTPIGSEKKIKTPKEIISELQTKISEAVRKTDYKLAAEFQEQIKKLTSRVK